MKYLNIKSILFIFCCICLGSTVANAADDRLEFVGVERIDLTRLSQSVSPITSVELYTSGQPNFTDEDISVRVRNTPRNPIDSSVETVPDPERSFTGVKVRQGGDSSFLEYRFVMPDRDHIAWIPTNERRRIITDKIFVTDPNEAGTIKGTGAMASSRVRQLASEYVARLGTERDPGEPLVLWPRAGCANWPLSLIRMRLGQSRGSEYVARLGTERDPGEPMEVDAEPVYGAAVGAPDAEELFTAADQIAGRVVEGAAGAAAPSGQGFVGAVSGALGGRIGDALGGARGEEVGRDVSQQVADGVWQEVVRQGGRGNYAQHLATGAARGAAGYVGGQVAESAGRVIGRIGDETAVAATKQVVGGIWQEVVANDGRGNYAQHVINGGGSALASYAGTQLLQQATGLSGIGFQATPGGCMVSSDSCTVS